MNDTDTQQLHAEALRRLREQFPNFDQIAASPVRDNRYTQIRHAAADIAADMFGGTPARWRGRAATPTGVLDAAAAEHHRRANPPNPSEIVDQIMDRGRGTLAPSAAFHHNIR